MPVPHGVAGRFDQAGSHRPSRSGLALLDTGGAADGCCTTVRCLRRERVVWAGRDGGTQPAEEREREGQRDGDWRRGRTQSSFSCVKTGKRLRRLGIGANPPAGSMGRCRLLGQESRPSRSRCQENPASHTLRGGGPPRALIRPCKSMLISTLKVSAAEAFASFVSHSATGGANWPARDIDTTIL